ncbi:unnamed protein product [Musa acuminata subsp. burmannicoides]
MLLSRRRLRAGCRGGGVLRRAAAGYGGGGWHRREAAVVAVAVGGGGGGAVAVTRQLRLPLLVVVVRPLGLIIDDSEKLAAEPREGPL